MGEKRSGKRWFGRKCCFLHSVCAWVSKGIWFQNLKNFEPHPQKRFVWCHVRGNVRDVWGKEVKETLAWEEVLFFYPQFVLGSATKLKFKTWKSFEPNPKIASYGAMLGAMCGMYGGKEVKGNFGLGRSAVSYTQFVLGSAKEFDFKTWKTLSPTHKKTSYGAMLGAMCGMYGGKRSGRHWPGRKCCFFTLSVCLGQQRNWKASSPSHK